MIGFFAISVTVIWLLFLAGLVFVKPMKRSNPLKGESHFVSIIVSLRNEESNVQRLCESLSQLSYPHTDLEILLGDDGSRDRTSELLKKHKPANATIYPYPDIKAEDFGKQKVLSDLGTKAKGEYLIFTDADMIFSPDWVQGLLSKAVGDKQLMVGLTKVSGDGWLDRMQNLDWLFNQEIIAWFANLGVGLTAWGNNMLISKKDYDSVGGHQSLPKTIVEDVGLLRQILRARGRLIVNRDPHAVATTRPVNQIWQLLHQRKRWMKGLAGLNPVFWLGPLIKLLFWPCAIYLSILSPQWLLVVFGVLVLRLLIIRMAFRVIGNNLSVIDLLIFEIYDFVFYLITFAFYLIPIRVVWKDRTY